jgi:hypothetical protein
MSSTTRIQNGITRTPYTQDGSGEKVLAGRDLMMLLEPEAGVKPDDATDAATLVAMQKKTLRVDRIVAWLVWPLTVFALVTPLPVIVLTGLILTDWASELNLFDETNPALGYMDKW